MIKKIDINLRLCKFHLATFLIKQLVFHSLLDPIPIFLTSLRLSMFFFFFGN